MQKILDELSSNEAFQYVQRLESEVEKLRKQLRDVTSQLQNAKVILFLCHGIDGSHSLFINYYFASILVLFRWPMRHCLVRWTKIE